MSRRFIGLAALMAAGLVSTGCPIRMPGARGNEVVPIPEPFTLEERNPRTVVEMKVTDPIPDPAPCDTTYRFTARVFEKLTSGGCIGYDGYFDIFQEAARQARDWVESVQCTRERCTMRDAWVDHQSSSCANDLGEAVVSAVVRCVSEGTPPTEGLPFPSPATLRRAFSHGPAPLPTPNRVDVDLRDNPLINACPTDIKHWIILRQSVPSCDRVWDYEPFINTAKRHAEETWRATMCDPENCVKLPMKEVGVRWDCQQAVVEVIYRFEIPCRPQ